MSNEIQFFSTSQKDAFLSMVNNIINCHNRVFKKDIPEVKTYNEISFNRKDKWPRMTVNLDALIAKLDNIIFGTGDPLSVSILLKNVSKNKIQGLGHQGYKLGNLSKEENEEIDYGTGHFRWDWKAYTLDELEIKVIKLYLSGQNTDYEKTELKYKNLLISSKLVNSGVKFPNNKTNNSLHNQFYVTVKNMEDESVTGFDFYGSTHDYNNGVTEIKGEDLLQAFECFISDAMTGDQEFNDFCDEFGYDNDSRAAEKIHKECMKSLSKAQSILKEDIHEFYNELNETINN